jgi:hypothetical protein
MSLLRNAQKNGTASSVTHVLPTTCPTRNSREPKAKVRKITESRTVPTRFDGIIAQSQNRFLRGVYTPKSASSENRKATPLAKANCGETKAESGLEPLTCSLRVVIACQGVARAINHCCQSVTNQLARIRYPVERS